jgi:hypothetical protein
MIKRFLVLVLAVAACGLSARMAGSAALAPLAQTELAHTRIFAYRGWQSTGIRLQPGEAVHILAEGRWLYTPGDYHGPEGHSRYSAPSFYPLPHVRGGALIGRIGEQGEPYYVGASGYIPTQKGGMLYLRIDDDILSDNDGWVEVEFAVQPAPPR